MRIVSAAGLCVLAPLLSWSQTAENRAAAGPASPSFEVASIKAATPSPDGRLMIRMGGDAGRIDYSNVSLRDVIRNAYKVKDHQISGPDWIATERFNISAKFPSGATREQVPGMLQGLLAERFQLTIHKEQKIMPAYALEVVKGGSKLHEAQGEGPGPYPLRMMMGPKGRHLTGKITIQQLADALSNFNDRPVLDETGLKGTYDIDLEWTGGEGPQGMRMMRPAGGPEGGPRPEGGAPPPHPENPENLDAPSLFTALQEKLGLRLDSRKAPVEIIVIDHVEKVPTEN